MKYEIIEVNSKRWFDLTPLLNEEFRDIIGYEGLYQVSNYGRVKTLKICNTTNKHQKTKILKECESTGGYYIVNLSNKSQRVHRLVAMAFIVNLNNYYCVNHIDGDKSNNYFNNLLMHLTALTKLFNWREVSIESDLVLFDIAVGIG